ncbi:MAG: YggT family protein [Anaerolineales bacterium]
MVMLLIQLIGLLVQAIPLLVIVYIVLTYIFDPYHPVRMALANIVEPMLAPIRRVVPLIGMLDISPVILILLVQLLGNFLISILLKFV